jgi:lysophospholipase L1-like esterase
MRHVGGVRLLVLVAAVLLAVEAALRVDRFGLSSAALGHWFQRPQWSAIRSMDQGEPWPVPGGAARWALQAGSPEIEYRLDADGFRIAAEAAPRRGGCRVLAVGDSNVFGYGVRADEAFPATLEALLRARGIDVEVRNAGICASDVAQQRRWLEAVLDRAAPDVVVLAVSPWSLRTDKPEYRRTLGEKAWNVIRRVTTLAASSALIDRARRRLFHGLNGLMGWPPQSNVAWELDPLLEPRPAFDLRFAAAAAHITQVVARLRPAEAAPLLVFVPLDVQTSTRRNRLYASERLPYPSWGFVDRDYTRDGRYADAMARLAEALSVPLIDVTQALVTRADESYLQDDYHLSAVGHRRIAEELAASVRDACGRIPVAAGALDTVR